MSMSRNRMVREKTWKERMQKVERDILRLEGLLGRRGVGGASRSDLDQCERERHALERKVEDLSERLREVGQRAARMEAGWTEVSNEERAFEDDIGRIMKEKERELEGLRRQLRETEGALREAQEERRQEEVIYAERGSRGRTGRGALEAERGLGLGRETQSAGGAPEQGSPRGGQMDRYRTMLRINGKARVRHKLLQEGWSEDEINAFIASSKGGAAPPKGPSGTERRGPRLGADGFGTPKGPAPVATPRGPPAPGRGGLLAAIQRGKKLKKRSAADAAGPAGGARTNGKGGGLLAGIQGGLAKLKGRTPAQERAEEKKKAQRKREREESTPRGALLSGIRGKKKEFPWKREWGQFKRWITTRRKWAEIDEKYKKYKDVKLNGRHQVAREEAERVFAEIGDDMMAQAPKDPAGGGFANNPMFANLANIRNSVAGGQQEEDGDSSDGDWDDLMGPPLRF